MDRDDNEISVLEARLNTLIEQGLRNPLISRSYLSEFKFEFETEHCHTKKEALEEIAGAYYKNNPLRDKRGIDRKLEGKNCAPYEAVKLCYKIGKTAKGLAKLL